ncbi:polysaccharide deacetylase family protein [Fodinisporobacter ferrooxydans]|uniref:Polysaccharide deacetylase family protein n=1 Tax=Fodinisporobacter ferrooxydans TaxID=2901836 RepID=A0ABY4CLL7_9BACL|nr:polysaccharide deacetylase family protein [Alicyclobacillaceae bacterium MYW30-H2]
MLTIVMYHYVRELKQSRYPEIKGLELQLFKEQIEYILKHYTVVTMEEVIAAVSDPQMKLPSNALLLTFDDGYMDHYQYVFPILNEKKIQGSFFPPAKVVTEHQVLDVNKIHYILASVLDKTKLAEQILRKIEPYRLEYELLSDNEYIKNYAIANRFDTKEVVFIKRMLQKGLPENLRNIITDELFKTFVYEDELTFSKELYMNLDQIQCMKRNGMFIGSHSYDHYWLDTLSCEEQKQEIDLSMEFLRQIGCDMDNWVMCYPYGAYNESLLQLLKERGCKVGLTTLVAIADLNKDHPLTLPRLDTNDLPKDRNGEMNVWTRKVFF